MNPTFSQRILNFIFRRKPDELITILYCKRCGSDLTECMRTPNKGNVLFCGDCGFIGDRKVFYEKDGEFDYKKRGGIM